jgi:peptidoglycan/xylan/chitin deacetylase (PgdA/CDA1 family)
MVAPVVDIAARANSTPTPAAARISGEVDRPPLFPAAPAEAIPFPAEPALTVDPFGDAASAASTAPGDPLPATSPRPVLLPGSVPILMYHYIRINPVATDRAGFVLSVTPADFESQMRFLASHGFTAVTMADVREHLQDGKPLPSKPVAITFDDGYDDAYSAALPILQKYHFVATFYVITGFVDRGRYLSWDQVVLLDRVGMEIASHTVTHPSLPLLGYAAKANQLLTSQLTLESRLGHAVLDFCYPGGQLDVPTEQAVMRAGYLSATTTTFGYATPGDDLFRLPRVRVSGGEGLARFASLLVERLSPSELPRLAATATVMASASPAAIARVVPPTPKPEQTRRLSGHPST